jgi:hypothetical protein
LGGSDIISLFFAIIFNRRVVFPDPLCPEISAVKGDFNFRSVLETEDLIILETGIENKKVFCGKMD